jgi:hypothetical protein
MFPDRLLEVQSLPRRHTLASLPYYFKYWLSIRE